MRVTALGTGTIALSAHRSCSGYLVDAGDARVLLDCGSGITRRLAELALPWSEITHVALTHFHIDHHGDLPPLIFASKYGVLPARSAPLEIIGPPGTRALLERLGTAYGEWLLAPGFPVTVRELPFGEGVDLAPGLRLDCRKVPHTPESVAYSMARGIRRIVYSGDMGLDDGFADWARGADVLICECSLPAAMAIPEHLTPEQCAIIAERAAPRQLVLTHFYPPVEAVDIRGIVAQRFSGAVTLAHDGWHIEIEDR